MAKRIAFVDKNRCVACGVCMKICPTGAVHVEQNLATIDYSKCTSCGLCVSVCPKHLITDSKRVEPEPEEA